MNTRRDQQDTDPTLSFVVPTFREVDADSGDDSEAVVAELACPLVDCADFVAADLYVFGRRPEPGG